jgi:hypothetical protein
MLPREIRIAFADPLPVANASAGVTAMPSLPAARASWEEFQYASNSIHTCRPSPAPLYRPRTFCLDVWKLLSSSTPWYVQKHHLAWQSQ